MNDNPTEEEGDGEYIVRDIDIEREQFIRGFFNRQRDIQRQSLAMVANLAQANNELILSNGLNEVAAKRTSHAVINATNIISDKLLARKTTDDQATNDQAMATACATDVVSIQHAVVNAAMTQRTKREVASAEALDNLRTAMKTNINDHK